MAKSSKQIEVVFTAVVLLLGLVVGLGFFVEPLRPLLHPLLQAYLISLEIFFRLAETNEMILAVSGVILALGLFSRQLLALAGRLPAGAAAVLRAALGGFLALLALLAQVYVLAFAVITQPLHLAVVLAAGVGVGLLWSRRLARQQDGSPAPDPSLPQVPQTVLLSFLVIYFFLGMIQGHLATPLVHGLSAAFAHLSSTRPVLFRLLAVLAVGLPLLPWLPGLLRRQPNTSSGRARWVAPGLVLLAVGLLCLLPGRLAVHGGGVLWAMVLAAAMASAGFSPLRLLHPDPRRLMARVLFLALLGVNTVAVHYLGTMWECSHTSDLYSNDLHSGLHPAVRRISAEAGAFSMAVTADGRRLLASLREPQQVVSVDLARNETRTLLRLDGAAGTGHLFSWQEPENLLRIAGGRFLLLRAMSDDQERNVVAVLDREGKFQQYLARPQAGVSDMVTDGKGRVYLSTEFQGQVFVLDQGTLALLDTVHWPGAETNRVLVDPAQRRMYSLGLWSDPMLRVMDLSSKRELKALDVGTLSWDMAHDPRRRRLYLPKFMTGEVLVIDDQQLTVQQRWSAGFGARVVRLDAELRLLYVGAMYASTVTILDADSGQRLLRLRLGGHIKGLHLDARTHKAYVGCDCGIFEIDGEKLGKGR